MRAKNIFYNLISSNLPIAEDDIRLKKVRLMNFILLLGIPINSLFIFINYATQQMLFALFNILVVTIMSFTFFYLRASKDHIYRASHLVIFAMFLIHVPALFQGGIANSGFLWFFLFPLFAIFLTGRNAGRIWIAILFTPIVIVFLLSSQLTLPYEPVYLIFLLVALSLESVYVLFFESIQDRYERELSLKNRTLEHLTQNLQDEVYKQVAITRSQDSLLSQQSKMASVGEMMNNISHQWKQPLSTINILIHNVEVAQELEDKNIDQLTQSTLQSILNQTELMQSTMKDFLNFSRPDLQTQDFSLNHAINMMQTIVTSSFTAHKLELNYEPLQEDIKLHGKENEFVHAIMNIVNNAKDTLLERAIPMGKVNLSFTLSKTDVILYICDNAGGIKEKNIDKVFEPYFSTRVKVGGTGLGLHMSTKIIKESFQGSIRVINSDDGACFIITLNHQS